MRGKPANGTHHLSISRLIPAHAGKTFEIGGFGVWHGAHPRACGENAVPGALVIIAAGSSPRMRGKLSRSISSSGWGRLIPAHAGKTRGGGGVGYFAGAHPRACGENGAPNRTKPTEWGSSPRMRGKPSSVATRSLSDRLIPAHAGKTRRRWVRVAEARAHPRACGENIFQVINGHAYRGSSPRMRGKLHLVCVGIVFPGLIPAHAGKTISSSWALRPLRAHPRACGENFVRMLCPPVVVGSSPRMRGKPKSIFTTSRPTGLIPAHAGKTEFHRMWSS